MKENKVLVLWCFRLVTKVVKRIRFFRVCGHQVTWWITSHHSTRPAV